jgi:hypothetical protein
MRYRGRFTNRPLYLFEKRNFPTFGTLPAGDYELPTTFPQKAKDIAAGNDKYAGE